MTEAMFGFLGVIIGSFIPWIKELIHEKRSRTEQGTYLAIRVICILDEYTDKCTEVVLNAVGDQNSFKLPTTPTFPDDLDWKSIDSTLMYQILEIPNVIRTSNDHIDFVGCEIACPPDYNEYYEACWEDYTNLGLRSIAVAELLRKNYKIPERNHNNWNSDWCPKKYLEQQKQEIDDMRDNAKKHKNRISK